jgi:heme/copper-type cytochrome/quinol oxidase subunit 4
MNQQYISVLEGVLRYERNSFVVVSVIFAVSTIIALLVILVRFRKEKVLNRIIMASFVGVICVAFGLYCFIHYQYKQAIENDIEQCSFVTYSGDFVHDDYQRDSFYHNLMIAPQMDTAQALRYPDYGNQYRLHQDDNIIPVGAWTGTIIYAEHSKIVVSCSLEEK